MSIENDATIADLLNSLNKPREYVQRVYENMWECKLEHGNASVRIGITGAGRAPYYRIEYARDEDSEGVSAVYVGLGHRKREDLGSLDVAALFKTDSSRPDHFLNADNWSSCVMSLDEVGALRADLLKRRR
jgi:hypothetical protein